MEDIIEKLASAVHQQWMDGRKAEGWTYGPERNDALKQNPCMVPYEELPESEKDYDRETAKSTIRTLNDLGYEVVPRSKLKHSLIYEGGKVVGERYHKGLTPQPTDF